jgi:hypothetical protein
MTCGDFSVLYDIGFKKLTINAGKIIEKGRNILLSITSPQSAITANRAKFALSDNY